MSEWISVKDKLPKCSKENGSCGVEVIIHPPINHGERTAYFGRRQTDKPNFYKYGAVLSEVTHWMHLPPPPEA